MCSSDLNQYTAKDLQNYVSGLNSYSPNTGAQGAGYIQGTHIPQTSMGQTNNGAYGGFGQGGYGSQMGSRFQGGYGYGGGYGPTGNLWGNDLGTMYNTYNSNPQELAAQMQYNGISPFNMQQAGVMSPQEYTQMYRPGNQYQGDINPNQYYQPIYQTQYQNYASPYYSGLAYQNNMGQNYQSPFGMYNGQGQGIGGLLSQLNDYLKSYSNQPSTPTTSTPTTSTPTTSTPITDITSTPTTSTPKIGRAHV